jgi:DNA-binding NarL/FixJ family response regulator
MMAKIKVLLVDDHVLFREGLRSLLIEQDDLEIVGEAEDGLQAVSLAAQLQPGVILMDINMPVLDGVEATRLIVTENEAAKIIILSMYPQAEYMFQALKAGAKAYLLKDTRSKKLLEVIRAVHQGQVVVEPEMLIRLVDEFRRLANQAVPPQRLEPLTEQERKILTLVAAGASNKEIAVELKLAERTIKNYLSIIFQKLQVNNRTEAVVRAMRDGLVNQEKSKVL